jgi:lipopolysaccharide export system protein LptA
MNLSGNKIALLLGIVLLGGIGPVYAEKADRDKPIYITSDRINMDDIKHISTFEGRVELTQGTLQVIAEKIVVTEDKDGYKFCVATGHVASFRQKRDEADEYVEGYGERIEYDSRKETVDFYVKARVKREQDDVRGDHITYSTLTEIFHVSGTQNSGRVHATIQPKNKTPQAAQPQSGVPVASPENSTPNKTGN